MYVMAGLRVYAFGRRIRTLHTNWIAPGSAVECGFGNLGLGNPPVCHGLALIVSPDHVPVYVLAFIQAGFTISVWLCESSSQFQVYKSPHTSKYGCRPRTTHDQFQVVCRQPNAA